MIEQLRQQIVRIYASAIGRHRRELVTPALILDLDVARRNIATMAGRLAALGTGLRPHTKVQKSPDLARLQVGAGAVGVCCGTVWEAIVMRRSGIDNVLMANITGGREKIAALAREAKAGGLIITLDHPRNATDFADALRTAGNTIDVLIDVDVGMGRGGVRSVPDAVALAQHIAKLPQLRLRGMQGYEGHCMLEPDRTARVAKAGEAITHLEVAVHAVERAGFPCEIVSAGGTGTYNITGARPRVTEIQAGSYVFMDKMHGELVPGFAPALTVLGTVVIEHGATIVFDCGRKSIGIDFVQPTMIAYPHYAARYFAEEHALFDVDDRCPLKLGDTAEFVPGYAPTTVNLYDAYHVVEKDHVVAIWPIIPRGPGHHGLLDL
jgi:D-serine deaminase-like pyridoxal phosphate-dependent protein